MSPALVPVVKVVVMMFVVEMMMTIPLPGVCAGVQRRRRTPTCVRPLGGDQGEKHPHFPTSCRGSAPGTPP
ncbi:MAG: hypothetical protein FIA95_10815 [Gemmatimonadetes bacterium]|nr:hypothetical protein [Gemmatimonadota bacterium]